MYWPGKPSGCCKHFLRLLFFTHLALFSNDTNLFRQVPSICWWYRTASHAAELTAGFYNTTNRDGYSPVFRMLKKHSVILKLVCYGPEFTVHEKDDDEAFADPEGLTWQVVEMFQASLSACDMSHAFLPSANFSTHKKKLQLHTQVINAAWDQGLPLCIESALPRHNGETYSRILDTAKPRDDPDRHHAAFFAYRQQQQPPLREACLSELCTFVKCMHG